MIFISTDAMHPLRKEILSTKNYDTLLDFLQDHYPAGFSMPTDIYTMFGKIELDDYDMKLNEDSVIVLVQRPAIAAALGLTGILAWLVNTAVMLAINFALSKLFTPDAPQAQGAGVSASTVYSLNSAQNIANLGGIIPVGYGTFRMYPSYIEQPSKRFENNDEYLYLLLCIGQGRYNIDKLQIDNIDVTNHPDVEYKLVNQENFGNIGNYIRTGLGGSWYITRQNTLSTPTSLEVLYEQSEFFEVNDSDKILGFDFDFVFPRGLLQVDPNDGKYIDWALNFQVKLYNASKVEVASRNFYELNNTPTPVRISERLFKDQNEVKYFRVRRLNIDEEKSSLIDTLQLRSVKELYYEENETAYGDITLLWCRIKATNAISSAGQQQVNGFFTRTDVGNKLDEVLTDIYTNPTYGGKLNSDDLFFPSTVEDVNGVYESTETVYDAMSKVSKAQKYTVYPVGQDILLKQDAPNNTTVGLYNETNILRDSFNIVYSFKDEIEQFDSVEVQYRTGEDWNPSTEVYPAGGISPQKVELFGVTTQAMAETMAMYLWKQDASRSKIITFDTDIQGFTLEFLDKIKISHSAVIWGEAGTVYSVNGSILETSEFVSSDSNITIRNIDTTVSDMLTFTKIDDFTINVTNLPIWVKAGMFYTIGVAKEYLVTNVRPKSENSVSVECIEYDEGIYT